MAFKTVTQYNEERFGGLFQLRNDGDFADVIFLYQSVEDVLVADTHYIKSADYSGYVHCLGKGCPACAKGIRVQGKLFIPLYNIATDSIEFWDRSIRFENQLSHDVFENYPNPSEYVFRITRHGAAGSVDTYYQMQAISRNTVKSYYEILSSKGVTSPAYYDKVCKEVSAEDMHNMLNVNSVDSPSELSAYTLTPRITPISTPATVMSSSAPSVLVDDEDLGDDPEF